MKKKDTKAQTLEAKKKDSEAQNFNKIKHVVLSEK